jgi:Outer membrane protein beta-barrel domain
MKKILYTSLFFCLLLILNASIAKLYAQVTSIGLRGGLNISHIYSEDRDKSAIAGGSGGISLIQKLSFRCELTAEGNFSMKGGGYKNTDDKFRLNYVEVPVYLTVFLDQRYTLFYSDPAFVLRPKIMIGGYFGQMVSGTYGGLDIINTVEIMDYGVLLGGGANIALGDGKWLITDIRYAYGLGNLQRDGMGTSRNGAFTFNVGISFPIYHGILKR